MRYSIFNVRYVLYFLVAGFAGTFIQETSGVESRWVFWVSYTIIWIVMSYLVPIKNAKK